MSDSLNQIEELIQQQISYLQNYKNSIENSSEQKIQSLVDKQNEVIELISTLKSRMETAIDNRELQINSRVQSQLAHLQNATENTNQKISTTITNGQSDMEYFIGTFLSEIRDIVEASYEALDLAMFADDLIDNAINEAYTQAERAKDYGEFLSDSINKINSIAQNSQFIFKGAVTTYSQLQFDFSEPQNGWTVYVEDIRTQYRYSSSDASWIIIGKIPEVEFVARSSEPNDTSLFWLDINE